MLSIFFIIIAFTGCNACFAQSRITNDDRVATTPLAIAVEGGSLSDPRTCSGTPHRSLDEYTPGSTIDTVGITWWDNQAYGTLGKTIAVDRDGYVHFVWTKGLDSACTNRHVFYNVWDPATQDPTLTAGIQVDGASRAGYATVDVDADGFAFPTFHQRAFGGVWRVAAAIDFLPRVGAFSGWEILPRPDEIATVSPRVSVDREGTLHVVCSDFADGYFDGFNYYSQGTPQFDTDGSGLNINWNGGLNEWSPDGFYSVDLATSRLSSRVAVAWIDYPTLRNEGDGSVPQNVMLRVSEDGGQNWGETINVTALAAIDTDCVEYGGTPTHCNGDTLRPWLDLSLIFDNDENLHLAFTAHGWFYWDSTGLPVRSSMVHSNIWHWDEQFREYNIIAEAWYRTRNCMTSGVWNVKGQRPSLAIDTTSGYLYCSFQKFDSIQCSAAGFAQADAWVTVSTSGGRSWAEPTNVTGTDGGVGTPAGECRSERAVCLAKYVTDGRIHMLYVLDRDAGSFGGPVEPEGVPQLNPVIYQRIPVEDIPERPVFNPCRAFRRDSTGFPQIYPCSDAAEEPLVPALPSAIVLYPNVPNPFNAATTITYALPHSERLSLRVFDLLGREVAVLADGLVRPGTHRVTFDGSGLASGLYFARLDAGEFSRTTKLMLLR